MKKALILSAGGTASELADLLAPEYEIIHFLDDNKLDEETVIGGFYDVEKFASDYDLYSAIGSFRTMGFRKKYLEKVNMSWLSFVSDKALVYPSAHISDSITVFPNSVLAANSRVEMHAFIYHNCILSHDSRLGKYSMLSNNATVSGNVSIGENTYVGSGAVILEGLNIGNNCIIAAGVTVIDHVSDNSIYTRENKIKTNHYHES